MPKTFTFTRSELVAFSQSLLLDLNASLARDQEPVIARLRTPDFAKHALDTAEKYCGHMIKDNPVSTQGRARPTIGASAKL